MEQFVNYLTENDIRRKFSVPAEWLRILSEFGEGHEVVVRALDGKRFYWEFYCAIRRRGRYRRPVFQSREWLKFVNKKGLTVGDKNVLCEEEDHFRGTKYRIRAQKSNGEGLWVDV
ncbi:hypothetical protein TIFTF001_046101 [Ficus carica]|uniref:TF-B3 domain-containing protein n=1 Tax=Ficus carica TaxID=3494 RepID=A0AA87Z7H3_FICCA|nr:hypothetical protein TIFTF001_046101 [Ficus carica]